MAKPLNFEIYTSPYNPYIGGVVVLYQLGDLLNRLGAKATIWPILKPALRRPASLPELGALVKYPYRHWRYSHQYQSPYDLKLSNRSRPGNAIVIYPEIVCGNPLGARHVCRWLLNTPMAVQGRPMNPGRDDLFVHYDEVYLPEDGSIRESSLLRIFFPHPAYKQTNFGKRSGACFLVRKGHDRELDAHPADAIQVDAMSHEQKARVFNECELFISYDDRTMYSTYAALCGCRSVVIPRPGVDIDHWDPAGKIRLGIAYGVADLPRAMASVPQLLSSLEKEKADSYISVARFIERCQNHFSPI
jgi:hypothetical protein